MPQAADSLVPSLSAVVEGAGAGPNSAAPDTGIQVPAVPGSTMDGNASAISQAVVAPPPDVFHVVDVGRQPGLFVNLPELVDSNIHRIPGGRAKKYATEEAAWRAFTMKLLAGEIIEVTVKDERVVVNHAATQRYYILPREQIEDGCTKFYVVFEGRLPGVFGPDDDVQANVANIPNARWSRVYNYEEARSTFCDAMTIGFVKQVDYEISRRVLGPVDFDLDWERV